MERTDSNEYPTCLFTRIRKNEPGNSFSYKMACTSKTSDQPAHPHSLIRVFPPYSEGSQGSKASSSEQQRLLSACLDWQYMQFYRNAVPRLRCQLFARQVPKLLTCTSLIITALDSYIFTLCQTNQSLYQ